MPFTAKLSRKFYETLGDEMTNELVEWFNQVDATYRADLRELNELNFQRFDAKLEQRLAQQDVRWEGQFAALRAELHTAITEQGAELGTAMAELKAEMHRSVSRYWAGTVIPLAGLIIALHALG